MTQRKEQHQAMKETKEYMLVIAAMAMVSLLNWALIARSAASAGQRPGRADWTATWKVVSEASGI